MGRHSILTQIWRYLFILISVRQISSVYVRMSSFDLMKCSYGERGSLTATCVNATSSYFKNTPYRFDHLDETLRCLNCSLQTLESGMFDISGNHIKNLDLTHSHISFIKQRVFVGLIFLEELNLANNEIKSVYPATFSGIKKLSYINLENNSINILSEDGFLELINLKTLNLRNNQIKSIATSAFNGLVNLNVLYLSNNQIMEVKDVFNNLTSLQVLDLSSNSITSLTGKDFDNLTMLLDINLSKNYIKSIPRWEFSSMHNLRRLDISLNMVQKIGAGSFLGLDSLETLDLSHNIIEEIPQKTLLSLHSLTNLNMSYNKLFIFQTGLYSGLPQLRTLNLSHNSIEDMEITGVLSLYSLHTLDFSNNNITDVDYVGLISRLPKIAYLNMEDNFLPCSLEHEMDSYFAEDNFKFILWRNELGAVKCDDTVIIKKVNQTYIQDSLVPVPQRYVNNSSSSVWIILLLCVAFILVGILYYLQFRIYKEIRAVGVTRTTSEVQLISSHLEARDNDFAKD